MGGWERQLIYCTETQRKLDEEIKTIQRIVPGGYFLWDFAKCSL